MAQSSTVICGARPLYLRSPKQQRRKNACCARDDREARRQANAPGAKKIKPRFGILSDVDPNAPLMKPIVGNTDEDYTKRSKDRFKSDFIWNTNWQDQAKMRDENAERAAAGASKKKQATSGFLSFSRVTDLNDMSIDLSKKLMEKPKPLLPPRSPASTVPLDPQGGKGQLYRIPPTSGEVKSWARSSGYSARNTRVALVLDDDEAQQTREEAAKEAADAFEASKKDYQLWTTVTAAVCTALTFSFYTRDIAASYLVGALGGIVYLRLLGRGVDSVAPTSFGEAAGSALGQQRLLIPVILVLFYNRYNFLYAESMGLHMELLPMLAGFFTYKAGVLGKASLTLFRDLSGGGDAKA